MANDRLFIACTKCGKGHLLYKYYPSGGYTPEYGGEGGDRVFGASLGNFFEKHLREECHKLAIVPALDLGNARELMVLVTEAEFDAPLGMLRPEVMVTLRLRKVADAIL